MRNKKNILIFPCGSEVALEIFRSIENSTHFNIIGGSSVDDHGRFVFKNYIKDIPFIDANNFIASMQKIVLDCKVDAIFPAMDSVITILKRNEKLLGCKIVSSDTETTEVCLSKRKTYSALKNVIATPKIYLKDEKIDKFPVFLKPEVGYGSRGVYKADNLQELNIYMQRDPKLLILEFLPGKEYTVDCFTNYKGELLFVGPRERQRISNGISVHTSTMPSEMRFTNLAESINGALKFNGAWFFQVKENLNGELVLMEVATRMAGSSSVYRAKGINFASLSLFNAFEIPVEIVVNKYEVELDRALCNKYKINIEYDTVYIDFDDTLIIDNKVNTQIVSAIYQFINMGKRVILITKHEFDIRETLKKYRLSYLFDEIIHLEKDKSKLKYIIDKKSIFIDDSFSERKEISEGIKIPVFSLDMIETLV